MEATVEQVSPVIKKMTIELPAEETRKPYEQALNNLKRTANIPGFRRGKAPTRVVESRYRRELEGEVLRYVARDTYPQAVREKSEELGAVIFEEMTHFEFRDDRSVETQFYIENLPEFELTEIDGETLEIPEQNHDLEKDLEMVLKDIQQQMARFKPIERELAEEQDYAEVAILGTTVSGEEIINNDSMTIKLVPEGQWELLVPELIGMKQSEERTVQVTFPEEDRFGKLKGMTITYTVTLNQLSERVVPEMDDELAREMGQFDTLDALKADIRTNLKQKYDQADRGHRQRAVMAALLDRHEFDVPPSLVDREARQLTESYFRQLAQYGIPMERDEEKIRAIYERQKDEAVQRVRESLVLTRFADEKNVDVTESDLNEVLEKYAAGFGEKATADTVRKLFEERGELDNIRSMVRQDKTFDLLIGSVSFKETAASDDGTAGSPKAAKSDNGSQEVSDADTHGD